jgi:sugar fermentation stimulation protein A
VTLQFPFATLPATFVARPNRFLVIAQLESGQEVRAHCPDPGRLRELLCPGAQLYVSQASAASRLRGRRTEYDLRFVVHPTVGTLVSLDSRLPNLFVAHALHYGLLDMFGHVQVVQAEVVGPESGHGIRSRFDFLLTDAVGNRTWLEVKSVTLVEDRVALFPDAPTVRGTRHLCELVAIAQAGHARAAVLFVVQRPDADCLKPCRLRDPEFAAALVQAANSGVNIRALTCRLTLEQIAFDRVISVDLR